MLNVNPVNLIPKINRTANVKNAQFKTVNSDVFIKNTNNVSFKGSTQNKKFNGREFIVEHLSEIIQNPQNKIGQGNTHSAYHIPECDDYILRMPSSVSSSCLNFSDASLKDTEDRNLTVNVGQKIGEIALSDDNGIPVCIEILKKQTGKSIGVPPFEAISIEQTGELRNGELPYSSKERKEQYASTIHEVAQLPVAAFEKLISDIQIAADAGYAFDHLNSNNLLVDSDKNAVNVIDMYNAKLGADYGNVLYALTNINYLNTYASKYEQNPVSNEEINQAVKDTIKIIEKYTQAMKNKDVKFRQKYKTSLESFHLINSVPFSFFCKTGDYSEKWDKLEQMGLV